MSSNTENQRVNFASIKNPMKYPDFLEVQLKSFQDFLQLDTPPEKRKNDGLYKVFAENFPIADTRNNKSSFRSHIRNRTQINILNNRIEIFMIRISTIQLQFCFQRHAVCEPALQTLIY